MPQPEEIRPVQALRALPPTQDVTAGPVTIAPHLPTMEKRGEVKTVQRNTLLPLMGAGAPRPTTGRGTMLPVPSEIRAPSPPSGNPQQTPENHAAPASQAGYVRLTVRLDKGKLSITGAKQVPGPLAVPSSVIHGYAYEVLADDQQVALGSIPDVGVRRSFANRDVEGPEGKHHFATIPTIEFFVRIPKSYLSTRNLPKLNIVLHDIREAPDRFATLAPLQKQPAVSTVEVGRLAGIRLDQVLPTVRPVLEQIISETDKTE
jgi:hypothetical protein